MSNDPTQSKQATELPPTYDPTRVEPVILKQYLDTKAYAASPDDEGAPYSIVIPPPNVTAALHLGHALNNTLQDVLTRVHRMRGFNTIWMPGTDHAGIATQTVVDKRLQQEGKPALKEYKQKELNGENGREQFIEKITAWKDEYEQTITNQLKEMGCSCDWDRQRFTMDDQCAKAVREAFFQLFKDGLIYRGKRLVNWDPVSQTALADDEVEMQDVDGNFYYMKYPIVQKASRDRQGAAQAGDDTEQSSPLPDGRGSFEADEWIETGEFATVATTRPETMLGDTAVAVNPDDAPRAKYIGRFVKLPIVNRVIPIVGDDYVVIPDPDSDDSKAKMASGFLKVTPAHDPNDYEIGQRHDLPVINVMAPDASISIDHGWPAEENPNENKDLKPLVGLAREDARKAIVKWFKDNDLMAEVKPYRHAVGHSYRSHVPIEPYYTDQWYVKVTDDRLKGAALRAMAEEQRHASEDKAFASTSRDLSGTSRDLSGTSRDREGAVQTTSYLITFTTYGTWLHGTEKGSVDSEHNLPGTPYLVENEARQAFEQEQLKHPPVVLEHAARICVRDTIQEVCRHRGWKLAACHVRTNHVHAVVSADAKPERVMNDFKSYATRRLNEAGLHEPGDKTWTRHGSTRYLNDESAFDAARKYVLEEQGEDLGSTAIDNGEGSGPLPDGRGSSQSGRGSLRQGDGGLTFTPERYAKTFQTWHENIRDWCISRQLWWGHRIPVWSGRQGDFWAQLPNNQTTVTQWNEHEIAVTKIGSDSDATLFVCLPPDSETLELELADIGFTQDPDVLDTWFSSALWPLSTMGWPDDTEELKTWNPTSVLCTAREIITLWVSRMVMFNRYFTDPARRDESTKCDLPETSRDREGAVQAQEADRQSRPLPDGRGSSIASTLGGQLPFKDVFIHAMIQDGHGQKMSKSLGNGVDPMDIIHSHGADAMRYTLTKMTTQTQDVRLPVDMVDPHTGETFTPEYVTASGGVKVAAPIQERNGKKMVSSYGVASGKAKPTDDMPLARNTSEKFDEGQKFANKLWNAFRFALSNLTCSGSTEGARAIDRGDLQLADRWILNQLTKTIDTVNRAIDEYRFSDYATAVYDFFWRDLCDWYIEIVKRTVKDNPAQQRVLATCLDASLRLLHPAMPFITERLWQALNAQVPAEWRGLDGFELKASDTLIRAPWPATSEALLDADAERDFELIRSIVVKIREARTNYKIPPRQEVEATTQAPAPVAQLLLNNRGITQPLTGCVGRGVGPKIDRPAGSAAVLVGDVTVYLHDVVDLETEKARLDKQIADKQKQVKTFEARLGNAKYVNNAPAHLVQETRDQHAAAVKELEQLQRQLIELSD
ncbi:MAG: class I tRNA ligase family protein [Phycisphaeraceae bacterium]